MFNCVYCCVVCVCVCVIYARVQVPKQNRGTESAINGVIVGCVCLIWQLQSELSTLKEQYSFLIVEPSL